MIDQSNGIFKKSNTTLEFPLTVLVTFVFRHGSVASESSETSEELVAQELKITKKYTRSVLYYIQNREKL